MTCCWILAQQSVAPYECGVIEISQSALDAAMGLVNDDPYADTCIAIARRYRACETAKSWPGRYQGVTPYEPPAWAGGGSDEVPNMEGLEE